MQPGRRRQLDPKRRWARLLEQAEQLKASIRAKVEHPFHVIKNLFRHKKVRYKGLAKNTAQLFSLFGLANLVLAKRSLLASMPEVRPECTQQCLDGVRSAWKKLLYNLRDQQLTGFGSTSRCGMKLICVSSSRQIDLLHQKSCSDRKL